MKHTNQKNHLSYVIQVEWILRIDTKNALPSPPKTHTLSRNFTLPDHPPALKPYVASHIAADQNPRPHFPRPYIARHSLLDTPLQAATLTGNPRKTTNFTTLSRPLSPDPTYNTNNMLIPLFRSQAPGWSTLEHCIAWYPLSRSSIFGYVSNHNREVSGRSSIRKSCGAKRVILCRETQNRYNRECNNNANKQMRYKKK